MMFSWYGRCHIKWMLLLPFRLASLIKLTHSVNKQPASHHCVVPKYLVTKNSSLSVPFFHYLRRALGSLVVKVLAHHT